MGTRINRAAKKSKVDANGGDLISNLPESVVCHILSRLPSKDAMRTSVLSRDWEYKWTSIYNIDIKDTEQFSDQRQKKTSFLNFVDRILLFSNGLRSFRLKCCDKYESSRLIGFISAAFMRNIESFKLCLMKQQGLVLPRSLLNNASLRKLKLASPCIFKVPTENRFPNLMYMSLYRVEILNQLSGSDRLVFTFPVLKTFQLVECTWSNANLVDIHSPSLSTFKCDTPSYAEKVYDRSIKICGAKLETFECSGSLPENTVLYESTVFNATIKNYPQTIDLQSCFHVRKLLKGLSSATYLQLKGYICQAIAFSQQEHPLPRYDMLQRLVIVYCTVELLLEFLHSAPSLKFVEIQGISSKEFDWDAVDYVPYCVISRLQEVELTKMSEKNMIPLAKFFLKNGVELKNLYVDDSYLRPSRKEEIVMKLLKFPGASSSLVTIV